MAVLALLCTFNLINKIPYRCFSFFGFVFGHFGFFLECTKYHVRCTKYCETYALVICNLELSNFFIPIIQSDSFQNHGFDLFQSFDLGLFSFGGSNVFCILLLLAQSQFFKCCP
jgi:hypothetical protein